MASWDDDNYDLDSGFVNKLDEDSKISVPVSADAKEQKKGNEEAKKKQREIEEKRKLADVEDFMSASSPDAVNSKDISQPTSDNKEKAKLKASLIEASTIDDFMRLSSEISDIINSARESEHYVKLLVEIVRRCAKDLPPDDIRHLAANINSLHKTQDKKKKGKRPNLKLAPGKKGDEKAVSTIYDEFNLEDNPHDVDSGDEQYYKKGKDVSIDEDKLWSF